MLFASTVDFFILVKSLTCSDSSVPLLGISKAEEMLSVLGESIFDSLVPLKSFACFSFALLTCGSSHVDFPPFVRTLGRSGSLVLPPGISRVGPLFKLSVVDSTLLEPSLLLRSLFQCGSSLSQIDSQILGLTLSLHTFAYLSFTALVLGMSQIDSILFVPGRIPLGFPLSLRSFS